MTTKNHTPIATGAAANASTFNTPLGSLDAAIGDETALTTTAKTSVVAAINELDAGKLESGASAALIANTPAGSIAATNVQTAINELDTEKQPLDADLTAIAAISPSNDDVIQRKSGAWTNRTMAELKTDLALTAANVANVAAGTIAAVTVQAAIDELDSEKAALSHTHTVSAITDQSNWKLDNFGTAEDNTDLNATTTNHGLLAKLSGAAGYFMDGLGAWARAIVGVKYKGSATMEGKYINFLGSAVTSAAYNALTDSVDVTITGGSGAGASEINDLTDVDVTSPIDNQVLSYASGLWVNSSSYGHAIQDEGTTVTARNTINFVGAGVTAADVSPKTTVTIPGMTDNAIINPCGQIFQRGTAYTLVKDAYNWDSANTTGADRFEGMATGTAVSAGTFTNTNAASCGGYAFLFSLVTLTGTGVIYLRHRIESSDAIYFKNQTASFSCKAYQNTGGTINYTIYIRKADTSDVFTAVTAISNSGSIPVPNGAATTLKYESISMGDCSAGIEIEIMVACGAITTKNFEFTELKFELSPTVTPFVPRTVALETLLCQRFCQAQGSSASVVPSVGMGNAKSTTRVTVMNGLICRMRTIPTLTATASYFIAGDGVTNTALSAIALVAGSCSTEVIALYCDVASGLTQYRLYMITLLTADKYFLLTAEL